MRTIGIRAGQANSIARSTRRRWTRSAASHCRKERRATAGETLQQDIRFCRLVRGLARPYARQAMALHWDISRRQRLVNMQAEGAVSLSDLEAFLHALASK